MLMGRFIRKELLANKPAKEFSKINLEVFENHLAYKELGIGEQTRSKALKPDARSEDWSLKAIKMLAKKLKVSVDLDKLSDEWRIYQLETITEDWYKEFEEPQKFIRVDHFWRKIDDLKDVMGEKKFLSIMKIVKTALILGHGNAEVETGFSEVEKVLQMTEFI